MTELRALIITDRIVDSQRSTGFRWRIRSLQSWLETAGFEVVHRPLTTAPLPSIAGRFFATLRSVRSLRAQAEEFDVVLIHAMNAPHMVWLSQRLSDHGAVVLDLCDSLALWAEAVPWRVQPYFRLRNWLAGLLLRIGRDGITCSYATYRDATAERSVRPSHRSIIILCTTPEGLDDMEPYVGPPTRIVVPADVSAAQNVEALSWLEEAILSGGVQLAIPIEIYGPVAPNHQLPSGVTYMGWAPRLRDIYQGQTAVFAPTVRGGGIQGKYLEAVTAGRPVVVGRQPAEAIPGYAGALPFSTPHELAEQLGALQSYVNPLDPGSIVMAPESELIRGVIAVKSMASEWRARR